MQNPKTDATKASLRAETFKLLRNRPATIRLLDVAEATKLPFTWVRSFHLNGDRTQASVDKVQTLYEYLTGTSLL